MSKCCDQMIVRCGYCLYCGTYWSVRKYETEFGEVTDPGQFLMLFGFVNLDTKRDVGWHPPAPSKQAGLSAFL